MALFKSSAGGKGLTIKVTGYLALSKRIEGFGKSIRTKAVKKALKEMGKPIVKSVAKEAPKDTKILSQNIKAKVLKSKRTGTWSLRIGAQNKKIKVVRSASGNKKFTKAIKKKIIAGKMGGNVRFYNPSKYSHLVAGGTKRGVRATDYLRKGLNAAKPAATAVFIASMKTSIAEAAKDAKATV